MCVLTATWDGHFWGARMLYIGLYLEGSWSDVCVSAKELGEVTCVLIPDVHSDHTRQLQIILASVEGAGQLIDHCNFFSV